MIVRTAWRLAIGAALLVVAVGVGHRPAAAESALAAATDALTPASDSGGETAESSRRPIMFDARIVGDDTRVRFIADLSVPVEAAVFTLADPYRIVIDLPDVRFALPDLAGTEPRGLASAFRYGSISSGKSRIVIDVTGPVSIDKSFAIAPADGQPARFVVDVLPSTRAAFLSAPTLYREPAPTADDRPANLPGLDGDKPVIVLDPGHGGIDTGARGEGGTVEKDVVLSFARVLGAQLLATDRYRVVYTRRDDTFVALGERVKIARHHAARLFISVHANSFSGSEIRGAIIYTASDQATDRMAAALAASENQSDVLAGVSVDGEDASEVKDILVDLTRRETRNFGVVFAQNLVRELGKSTRMFKIPHQEASFKVLEAPDVPSALIELGYLTNAGDEKQLVSPEWQATAAASVVDAIDAYFGKVRAAEVAQP
jgi:N-acetylmuramoyl-L-alanine amidase